MTTKSAAQEAQADQAMIVNLSGYRFVPLNSLQLMQDSLREQMSKAGVRGAIILAAEGINISIAGTRSQTDAAKNVLEQIEQLQGLWLKESLSSTMPHKRLRVRVRAEIIAFDGQDASHLGSTRAFAPAISAAELDSWLDAKKELTLLDTRNDYEIVSGTFAQAADLNIKHFRHFKEAVHKALDAGELDKFKPVVTFCTGGIRCEKAAPWLLEQGFAEVYQIDGGILNYLEQSVAEHWQGDCFVFDDRVEVNRQLLPTGSGLCDYCQLAVKSDNPCRCQLGPHYHATY